MKRLFTLLIVGFFVVGLSGTADAAKKRRRRALKMPKKTLIDFTAIMIDGKLKRPVGAFILERKDRTFDKLLDINESFLEHIVKAADEL